LQLPTCQNRFLVPGSIKVGLDQLQVEMFIGINQEEKKSKQTVFIDIECGIEVLADQIDKTVDYRIFESICKDLSNGKHYDLIETFAKDILLRIKELKQIKSIKLKVTKPAAIDKSKGAYILIKQSF